MVKRVRLGRRNVPALAVVLEDLREVLVPHYYQNFRSYKSQDNRQKGSMKWSREAQDLVVRRMPYFEKEYRFHAKCGSAFDLYSPPHDLVVELAMFQGQAVYEIWKLLFKMMIAGPSYEHLLIAMPQNPGLTELREPFNRLSFEVFERTHPIRIHWILLDGGPQGWYGAFDSMVDLSPDAIRPQNP